MHSGGKGFTMSREENAFEPGFYTESFDPGRAERLVLRFPEGELIVLPATDGKVALELELRGDKVQLTTWKPSIRHSEGILVVADEPDDKVIATVARVRVPPVFRDIEAHAVSGSIEIRGVAVDLLADTQSGDIRVSGGASVEATSAEGGVEIEKAQKVSAKVVSGPLRCRDIFDSIEAESQSGDVTVEAPGGNVVVQSNSGDVSILKPGGRLRVSCASGDVELEVTGQFAGGEISTTTGDVSLSLTGSDLELRAETLSGKLDGSESEQPFAAGPRRCAVRIGAGGRRLHVRSVSGDIEIAN